MDERFFELFGHCDELCDCCGVTCDDQKLYTVEVACEVTLCRQCINRFYALLGKNTENVRSFKLLKGNYDDE